MDTIVFIGTNKSGSSREAIKAAERLGLFTVLLTDRLQFIEQRLEFPDVHRMIFTELSNYGTLREIIMTLEKQGKIIKTVLSFVDPYVHLATALAEEFSRSVVSSKAIQIMEDKVLTRNLLKDLPISPNFTIYTPDNSLKSFIRKQSRNLPLIVKSPISAGSKDVLFAKNKIQLNLAMNRLLKQYENTPILLEEYLTGPQYLIETLVHKGNVHIVAIIEQEITFQKRFIVTGYNLSPLHDKKLYDDIHDTVTTIVNAFQMKNGACHLELRLVQGEWKLIEINPRISGGAMNSIIEKGYGINLVEETIQLFLGNKPDLAKKQGKYVYVHYITSDTEGRLVKVTGRERASKYPGVQEVYIKPRQGKILRPPLSMGDRYGYVLASADDGEEAKRIAWDAAKEIHFHLEAI